MKTISMEKKGALGERKVGKGDIRYVMGNPGEEWTGLLPALWLVLSLNTKGWEQRAQER